MPLWLISQSKLRKRQFRKKGSGSDWRTFLKDLASF